MSSTIDSKMKLEIEIHMISNRPDLDKFISMWNDVVVNDIVVNDVVVNDVIIKVLTLDYPDKSFVLKNGIKVEFIKQRTFPKTACMNQAHARNELLTYSTGDFVLFYDDWQKPDKNILVEHLKYLKQGYSVCGRRFECNKDGAECKDDYRNNAGIRQCGYGEFWTCNSSTALENIIAVNGFDNRYNGGTSGEDYDFGMRISRLINFKGIIYNPNAISYHYCHDHLIGSKWSKWENGQWRVCDKKHVIHGHDTSAYKYLPEYGHLGKWENMESNTYDFWWEGPIKYYKCKLCDEIGILDSMQVYKHNRDNNIIRVDNGLEQVRAELRKEDKDRYESKRIEELNSPGRKIIKDIFLNKSVGGMIGEPEGLFLYDIARKCKRCAIVEIGSSTGLSTICLGLGVKDSIYIDNGVKIYSIDPHIGSPYTVDSDWLKNFDVTSDGIPEDKYYTGQGTGDLAYFDNLKKFGVDDVVVSIVDYSEIAYKTALGREWDQEIELLVIDADHRYNYVKMDFDLFGKWVIDGGRIVMHDRAFPGVMRVINESVIGNSRYYDIRDIDKDPYFNFKVRKM